MNIQAKIHVRFLPLLLVVLLALPAHALPRFTLAAGSRCSNCHVNPQGGGLRSSSGWYMMNTTSAGMVGWDKLGLPGLHKVQSNTFFDDRLTLGGDFRLQAARQGIPTVQDDGSSKLPPWTWIPMQLNPGAEFKFTKTVQVVASINAMGFYFPDDVYPGRSNYDAWIRWTPQRDAPDPVEAPPPANDATPSGDDDFDAPLEAPAAKSSPQIGLPSLRVGVLQPSFGIRHDDHTLWIRGNAFNRKTPIMPPNYNDLGAELTWEGVHWLSVDVGGFWPRNFSAARFGEVPSTTVDSATGVSPAQQKEAALKKPMGSARVTFWPRIDSVGVNFWAGASALYTPNFFMQGGHFGVGKTYWGSLIAEVTHSRDDVLQQARYAWLLQADYPIVEWLTAEARYEQAHATPDAGATQDLQAVVVGLQWLPVPMLELRPEYRYLDTNSFRFAQYSLQIHVFY